MALWHVLTVAGLLVVTNEVDAKFTGTIINPNKLLHRKLYSTNLSDIEAVITGGIDHSVDKCTDFYQYACGGYFANNGTGLFDIATTNLNLALKDLVENPNVNSKVALLYQSCQNFFATRNNTFDAILDWIEKVDAANETSSAMKVAGFLSKVAGKHIFATFRVTVNAITSDKTGFLQFSQNALSLPSKEFYFEDRFAANREQLVESIEETLSRVIPNLTNDDLENIADSIFSLEKQLAAATTSATEASAQSYELSFPDRYPTLREIVKISPTAFGSCIEGFLGESYDPDATVLFDLREMYLAEMENIIKNTDLSTVKWYIKYQFISGFGTILDQYAALNNASSKVEDGDVDSANSTCINYLNEVIPDLISDEYIKYNYPDSTNDAIDAMITALLDSMKSRLNEKGYWMDKETASFAYDKLSSLDRFIGGIKSTLDYSSISWQSDDFLSNLFAVKAVQTNGLVASIGAPQTGQELEAAIVNAFYSPENNGIYFPAAILQPPIFSSDYPAAMTWGTIGAIIAHEITHSLDPAGIHMDPNGRYREKWTSSKRGQSIAKSKWDCFVDSYSQLDVDGDNNKTLGKLNGRLTVSENVADAGVAIAYQVYRALGSKVSFRGFSSDQLFFIANAQMWCSKPNDNMTLIQMLTDVHSPSKQRVNGEYQNFGEFAKAFNCPLGSYMNPRRKCSWWEIDSNKYC